MRSVFLLLAIYVMTSCSEQHEAGTSIENSDQPPLKAQDVYKPSGIIAPDDPTFIITTDTVSAYGPRSITRNMLQDRNGDLWFATWQGIINYNSKVFTNMTLKEGLKHFHVFSLLEDKAGDLWFGTIGGGVYRYNAHLNDGVGQERSFTYFSTNDGLAGNTVFCMIQDKAGYLWFGTENGLSRYDGSTFTSFTKKNGLLHDSVYAMVQDNAGKLWVGTEGGVNTCYDPYASPIRFIKEKDLYFRHVMTMLKDKSGKLWIGSQAGLCCYDPSTTPGTVPVTQEKAVTTITSNFVSSLFEDKGGKIWFGGDVNYYDPSAEKSKALTPVTIREGQNSNNLFCIFEDKSGNFWFGSMNGIRRYEGKPQPDGKGNFTEFREELVKP